jgi:hypothetical protein
MAIETLDLNISPDDGWTQVATSPTSLLIKPRTFHPWWVAVGSTTPTVSATRATGTITFTGLPVAAETVTVNGQVYTFRAAVAVANDVLIGVDGSATASNLSAAINAGAGSGTAYGTGTVANAGVTASVVAGVVTVSARVPGTGGNAITLAESATNVAVSGATLTGGLDALIGIPMGNDAYDRDEPFESGQLTGNVYIRIVTPPDSVVGSKMGFGVVRDQ